MVAFLLLAAPASVPFLPDLNAKLHPSDSTPWTILLVLTLITLLPSILMVATPMVRLLVVNGPGTDDELVFDDAGAQSGGPAGG